MENESKSETTIAGDDLIAPNFVVYPNETDGAFHVIYDGNKVTAAPGEKICIRAKQNHRHAWVEHVDPHRAETRAKTVDELLESVIPELRKFLEDVVRRQPQFDNGEEGVFAIRAGVVGFDDNDAPNVQLTSKASIEKEI